MKPRKEDIQSFLESEKERFIDRWYERVNEVLAHEQMETANEMGRIEFEQLFHAYIGDMMQDRFPATSGFLASLIEKKIKDGLLLSTLELVNASFMTTAREIFRSHFPDAFDTRMEYLEKLSQMILNNEVMLAQRYEDYLTDLNDKLTENANILTRHHHSLVEFIDIATHQLQAPLWSILGFVNKLQRKYYETLDAKGRHYLNRITANVSEMHQLIEDVTQMLLLNQDNMVRKDVYVWDIVTQSVKRIRDEIDAEFTASVDVDSGIVISGDPHHLRQLFYQVLKNSCQYAVSDRHGEVAITAAVSGDGSLVCDIDDNGIGIEPRFRELMFKPMERLLEKDVPGSGMGLTFARRIVESHGGSIRLDDTKSGHGIRVRIEFPGRIVTQLKK